VTESIVYLGLGANLGDARATIAAAFADLQQLPGTHGHRCSALFLSDPVDADGPGYTNAVACFETAMSPHSVLAAIQRIEGRHGRERSYRNAPRTLDLDLLLHGQVSLSTPELTVPHPRLHLRAFVLVPLFSLEPDLVVPGLGAIRSLLPAVSAQVIERLY
jgi:2-amino-4-hydroxy-6-hydroxymethyldihydropteridine diphosphokinase